MDDESFNVGQCLYTKILFTYISNLVNFLLMRFV